MSNKCLGLAISTDINKDKHCSMHLLLSRLLMTKSGSVPSAKESLLRS